MRSGLETTIQAPEIGQTIMGKSHLPRSLLRGKALLLAEAGAGGLAGWHSRPGEEARVQQVLIVT